MSCEAQFLLTFVEGHLERTGISPSRFGRMIAGDPRLVFDMRRGRRVNLDLAERVLLEVKAHELGVRQ